MSGLDASLPPGWASYRDPDTGDPYFHNACLNQTTWDREFARCRMHIITNLISFIPLDPGGRWKMGLFLDTIRERRSSGGQRTSEFVVGGAGPAQKLRAFFRSEGWDSKNALSLSRTSSCATANEDDMILRSSLSVRIERLSKLSCSEDSMTKKLRYAPLALRGALVLCRIDL